MAQTNAGICPKSDETFAWARDGEGSILPTEISMPNNFQLWCGDKEKICTFPFEFESKYYSEPYEDKCGTEDNSFFPIPYDLDPDLDLDPAVRCTGRQMLISLYNCISNQSDFRQ